ncbi:lysophospholipid acyltransferase family protein [Luteipulveratus halotolerans]|uniref:lysophospholipid acyltransferase family protein n=1 Tax=Luteipulveratus halotolerans TaxID=1631356 RepID=UPI0008FBF0BD|nr:lysophospholipid acyltransferase family protein [Luteipulveratus halotolerans]
MFYWFLKKILLGPLLNVLFRPWVDGEEHVPKQGGAILASNHLSFSDSFFLPLVVERRITFPAKMEYFTGTGIKGRLTAAFFRGVGQIPIDRSGGQASEAAIEAGLKVLRRGDLFGIYPEGTRSPDGRLYKGKTGVARMALEAKVPVLPVAMIDTDKAQPTGRVIPKIMRIGVRIGRPMDFSRYDGMQDDRFVLRSITDEIMYELMLLSGQEYVDVYAASVKDRVAARAKEIGSGAAALAHHLQEEAAARIERVQQRRAEAAEKAEQSDAGEADPTEDSVEDESAAAGPAQPAGGSSRATA